MADSEEEHPVVVATVAEATAEARPVEPMVAG